MINKYIVALMLCFIVNGEVYPNEQAKDQQETKNIEITLKQYSDFLEMEYKDFQNLLDAADIDILDSDAIFTKENQMKLVQFLQSISNPEKTSGEIECRKDEMLFCQSERRISDGRNGRNGKADNVICQCGPMFTRF